MFCEIRVGGINSLNLKGKIFSVQLRTEVGLLITIVVSERQSNK